MCFTVPCRAPESEPRTVEAAPTLKWCVFVPFHWGDAFARNTAAHYLTNPVIGRISEEPEFTYCAVQVEMAASNGRD